MDMTGNSPVFGGKVVIDGASLVYDENVYQCDAQEVVVSRKSSEIAIIVALLALTGSVAHAQCAPFHDSLNDVATIADNGGLVVGGISFTPAVNENGAVFAGSERVTYSNQLFASDAGSIALWFRKSSPDESGGIAQIGTVGQASSVGVFYANVSDVIYELKNAAGDISQLSAPSVAPQGVWVHIIVTWQSLADGTHLGLFINGRFAGYDYLSGAFDHTISWLMLGYTGFYGYAEGIIDELRVFDWALFPDEAYAEYVVSSNRHRNQPTAKPTSTGPVQVIGKTLLVNGQPFTVKGVGYAPTPIGSWPDSNAFYTNAAILARDLPLLESMHVNTIRTWSPPPNTALLNTLYYGAQSPIYTLVGFWIPQNGMDNYGDPATITFYENEFRTFINAFTAHPGVLGWLIGNELNLGLDGQDLADWYALADRLAEVAYQEEGAGYHPTLVVNGGMWGMGNIDFNSDDISMSFLDAWGHNTYFGKYAHRYFEYYDTLTAKPLIFTEYGIDAYDNVAGQEHQATQAEWVVRQWRQISRQCAGASVMAYSDEWWKADSPFTHDFGGYGTGAHPDGYSNEEWWGMLSAEDNGSNPDILHPRDAYYALADEFSTLPADTDADGDVDLSDLAQLLAAYGACDGDPSYGYLTDLDADGCVDLADLAELLSDYGVGS